MTELEYVSKLIPTFRIHFIVRSEVWDKKRKSRIDLVLNLKSNPDIFFGIECKIPDKKRGEKMGLFIKQAIRYSQSEFEVKPNFFKKIPILITPALSNNYFILNETEQIIDGITWHQDRHNSNHDHHSMNGFLGAFEVGEIRTFSKVYENPRVLKKYYKFMYSNCTLFDSRFGINLNNYKRYDF